MSTILLLGALGSKPEPGVAPRATAQFDMHAVPSIRVAATAPAAAASFTVKQVPDLRVQAVAPPATASFTALSKIDITVGGVAPAATASLILQWTAKPVMILEVLDPTLIQAPTALTVMLTDAQPELDVVFAIDGTVVATITADSTGMVGPTSLNVSEDVGTIGSHTVTATQAGAVGASATFTLARNPRWQPINIGPDAEPVEIPAAQTSTGVRRWVLQDLMPGGLGSYVMPINPTTMSTPHAEKALTAMHTTAITGVHYIFEGSDAPLEWEFSGYFPDRAMHDQLLAYVGLTRRFYLLDHRGRAWKVAFTNLDVRHRRRRPNPDGTWNDWTADYTVNAVVYDRNWWVPQ